MRLFFLNFLRIPLILAFAVAASGPAGAAGEAALPAFFGSWGGSAIAKNQDSIYFGVTIRDLDVTISGTSSGFDISWTTVFRRGGTPSNPNIRRKTTSLSFDRVGPGLYRAKGPAAPTFGETFAWGRLEENTLTVNIFDLNEKGGYQLSTYVRTITGSGMDLEFSVIRDGDTLRTVTGRLVKHR